MAEHPVIGYLVWAVLFGAVFAWEGISLVRVGDGFPTPVHDPAPSVEGSRVDHPP